MYSRLSTFASQQQRIAELRRRLGREIAVAVLQGSSRRSLNIGHGISRTTAKGSGIGCLRRPRVHTCVSSNYVTFSSLRASSRSAAPMSTIQFHDDDDENDDDDDDDENDDIEDYEVRERDDLLASSVSDSLPDDIFYRAGEEEANRKSFGPSSLDLELGIDSIWESHMDQLGDESDPLLRPLSYTRDTKTEARLRKKAAEKSAREVLENFDPQSPPETDDMEELQLWMECAAQRECAMKYQKVVDNAREKKAFDSLGMVQGHIVQWYQGLRDAIEVRQKEFLSSQDNRRAKTKYGPFLCALHPSKMAVTLAHEAIIQILLLNGKYGRDGVPLVKIAKAIGKAVEIEVVSERRIKERYREPSRGTADEDDDDAESESETDTDTDRAETVDEPGADNGTEKPAATAGNGESSSTMKHWMFSASHLKLFMEEMKRIDPKFGNKRRAINYAMRQAKQAMNRDEEWTDEDLIHVGAALLSILIENTRTVNDGRDEPAFKVEKVWSSNKKSTSFISMNERLFHLFLDKEFISWAAYTSRHKPMIVPPSDWMGPAEGGYRWLKVHLMRTHGSNVQQEALHHADLSCVYDGLNVLGKTAWKINDEILRVGQHCWENNIPIGDIPSRVDYELPPEPLRPARVDPAVYTNRESPESKAALAANRRYRESMNKRLRLHQKNMDLNSLRCSAMLKLDQASQFQQFDKIYFPYSLDFRGRAYPIPPHLSNVGSDLCRGMLTFADSKPLGKRGLYWLKVHLANFAGMDKVSFDSRVEYVEENMDKVRESAENPFSIDPWWMTLDDPFQGLATCREIVRAIDSGDPESYMCSLPVHMDGSCNGLQHYAALGRDTAGGKAVNLLEGDGPEDVYVGVMEEVIRRVAQEAERDVHFDTSDIESLSKTQRAELKKNKAAKLVNGLIDRGVVKRTVMTSVYGVTYVGARQQIQEKIEEKLEELGQDVDELDREIFAASGYLATVTIEVMGELFQGARKTQNWLADCARLITQQGHPVAWISPIGVPAVQPYRQKRSRHIVTVMQSVTVADQSDDLPVHKSRQVTAFPPNYVHSLDASHMLLTALEMDRRGLTFSAVHDSFWTHACDVDEMNETLRDCFIELYSQPLLHTLKESWELRYPEVEFPELPELGDLDLNAVKSATYFFQ